MKTKLMAMLLAAGAMLGAWAANVRVYVNVVPEAGWNPDRYFYAWAGTAQNFGAWPGIKVEDTEVLNGETWHYMDIDATDDEFYLIFNDGESHRQTIIVLIAPVKEGKRFFVRVSSEGETNEFSGRTSNYANIEYEKVQLWEGGPYWATMNIGAEIPEDSGYYFWWGDTVGYYRENDKWVASDGSSSNFSFKEANTPTYGKYPATLLSEGWITADGVLAPEHDAAHVQWGDGWRMPTYQEMWALTTKCDREWVTTNGVKGYVFRGKGDYSANSIFLPVTGIGTTTSFHDANTEGCYWSSGHQSDPYLSVQFWFGSGFFTSDDYYGYRLHGQAVRPVYEEPAATVSVTFDENFEGGAKTETNFLASATILANAPDVSARDGWTFAGWFDATEGGNQISATDLPTDGATYYAHWTPDPDQIAAGAAAALIAAIGDVAYTDESKAKIDVARAAYDALTPAQQALVANAAMLTAAEAAYGALKAAADAAAAAAAVAAIGAIGDVAYTDESKAKIDAARAAYDALTPAQQALVGNYATLTAAEAAYAALVPAPCYEVIDEADIVAPYAAPKAVTLRGAAYDGCDVVGIVELKLGKVNANKKTSKVSGSVTLFATGKKHTIKGVAVTGVDGTAPATVSLDVKGIGSMAVIIGGEEFAGALGPSWHVQSAVVGGAWAGGSATAVVDVDDVSAFGGGVFTELLPTNEVGAAAGGKWKFAKAATVKYAKPKANQPTYTLPDATGKALVIDTSKDKTNLSGLKLTYTPKTGVFKGSFKVFALQSGKLKKFTVNVNGAVVDGVGYGMATCKKPAVSWAMTVK